MQKGIIGKKLGMTQLFDANGKVVPVTIIEAGPWGYYSVYLNDLFWRSYAGNNYTRYTEQDMMELWARLR